MIYEDIVNVANAMGRKQNYLAQNSADASMFWALVQAINDQISGIVGVTVPELVGSVDHQEVFTVDGTISPQTIFTAEAAFYVAYVSHYISATTAATGTRAIAFGFTDGAGAASVNPFGSNLSVTGLNRLYAQVNFFATNGSTVTWSSTVAGFTTGSATSQLKIRVFKIA